MARPWLALAIAGLVGCGADEVVPPAPAPEAPPPAVPARSAEAAGPSPIRFEAMAGTGVDFVHVSGTTAAKPFPTANGSGLAIFDYDGDGRMDLYFASGNPLPLGDDRPGANRLYRNLGDGSFRDDTERSGLGFRGYCHAAIVGDVDNDGDADVFLGNFGPNALYLNRGDGTFAEIGAVAGLADVDNNWTSSAAFLDMDADGDLDLYVTRYGDWRFGRDDALFCGDPARKIRRYCSPKELRYARHSLYRNEGLVDGVPRFVDVTGAAGLARDDGHGFGVVAADLDDDGRIDLYVANDQDPNFLFLNRGDGTFRDASTESGAAYDAGGRTQSGMGVDAEDLDGDGLPEIFVTNFQDEYNTLYRNLGGGNFLDATSFAGLVADALPGIGWGCALADFDGDGRPDIAVANAHIDDNAGSIDHPSSYEQAPLLHRNRDGRRFETLGARAGPYFAGRHLGHGLATGDLDDDGRIDLVIAHKDGPPALLRNASPGHGHWLRLALVGTRSNRDAIGARVAVTAGGSTIVRQRKGGSSLMSSSDPRLLIGLGPATVADRIEVRWPSGARTVLEGAAVDRSHTIVEPDAAPEGR